MKLIDLSQPLFDGSPGYPFDPPLSLRLLCSTAQGDTANTEQVTMTLHCGTHMDAPYHIFDEGKKLSDYDLSVFAGQAAVLDLAAAGDHAPLTAALLEAAESANGERLKAGEIALLRTGWGDIRENSERWLHASPYLTRDGAEWLRDRGVRGVGIDHFSVGTTDPQLDAPPHQVLLGSGIWIVEDLNLPAFLTAKPRWTFLVLPLKFRETSGAPARAVIVDD